MITKEKIALFFSILLFFTSLAFGNSPKKGIQGNLRIISGPYAKVSFGKESFFRVGTNKSGIIERSLIKIDLSSFNVGDKKTASKPYWALTLTVISSDNSLSRDAVIEFYAIALGNASWDENTASWQSSSLGQSWVGGGGLGKPGEGYQLKPFATVKCTAATNQIRIPISYSLLNQWANGKNNGILIRLKDESIKNQVIRFYSSKVPNSALAPSFLVYKKLPNLIQNGSFELGLGVAPFHPGWLSKSGQTPLSSPPLPQVDASDKHTGKRALHLQQTPRDGMALLGIESPKKIKANLPHYISFWAKSNRKKIHLSFGLHTNPNNKSQKEKVFYFNVSQSWKKFSIKLPPSGEYLSIRAEFFGKPQSDFDVWVDDIMWTQEKNSAYQRKGRVELTMLPQTRTSVRYKGKPCIFNISANATTPTEVNAKLIIKDVSRNGIKYTAWQKSIKLTSKPTVTHIKVDKLKQGAYFATVQLFNKKSKRLIASTKERFTVLTDLSNVPLFQNFEIGVRDGLLNFAGNHYAEFNWRGYWTPDEYYQLCSQIGLRLQHNYFFWSDIEPQEGKLNFYFDENIKAASRNGCLPAMVFGTPLYLPTNYLKNIRSNEKKIRFQNGPAWIFYKNLKDITRFAQPHMVNHHQTVFAPDAQSYEKILTEIIKRYGDKLGFFELLCEVNLFLTPKAAIEYYFKPAYPVIKSIAPNLPVLMDTTSDFGTELNSYIYNFLKIGGGEYCDGISYHPYSQSTVKLHGLRDRKKITPWIKEFSKKSNKPLFLAETEVYTIGKGGFLQGWEAMQLMLLDWSTGAKWSCGSLMDAYFFSESTHHTGWRDRGTHAPGTGAVAINAFRKMLGGYRNVGRADIDANVLIAFFQNGSNYIATINAANFFNKKALLDADLSDIGLKIYDQWGERLYNNEQIPSQIPFSRETLYLKSNSPDLFNKLKKSHVIWSISLANEQDTDSNETTWVNNNTAKMARLVHTGMPTKIKVETSIVTWQAVGPILENMQVITKNDFDENKRKSNFIIRQIDNDYRIPYVNLEKDNYKNNIPKSSYYAYTKINSINKKVYDFVFNYIGAADIYVNGNQIASFSGAKNLLKQHPIQMNLNKGINHVLVKITTNDSSPIFMLKLSQPLKKIAIDTKGYIHQWAFIGPFNNPYRDGKFKGNSTPYPPEKSPRSPDFSKVYGSRKGRTCCWYEIHSTLAYNKQPWPHAVTYAFATVQSPSDIQCTASLGSDDGFVLWINGKEVGRKNVNRGHRFDEEKLKVKLHKGDNSILFKIDDSLGGGGFSLRFLDTNKNPIPLIIKK